MSPAQQQETSLGLELLAVLAAADTPLTKTQIIANTSLAAVKNPAHALRTLHRELAALTQLGYRLTTQQVLANRYQTVYQLPQDPLPPLQFAAAQELLLKAVLDYWSGSVRTGNILLLRTKLAALLSTITTEFGQVKFTQQHSASNAAVLLETIAQAKQVSFSYAQGKQVTTRTVSPLRLHMFQQRLHLVAFDQTQQDLRVFLLSRIVSACKPLSKNAAAVPATAVAAKIAQLPQLAQNSKIVFRITKLTPKIQAFTLEHGQRLTAADTGKEFTIHTSDITATLLAAAGCYPDLCPVAPQDFCASWQQLFADICAMHSDRAQLLQLAQQTLGPANNTSSARLQKPQALGLKLAILRVLETYGQVQLAELAEFLEVRENTLATLCKQLAAFTNKHDIGGVLDFCDSTKTLTFTGSSRLPVPPLTTTEQALITQTLAVFLPALPRVFATAATKLITTIGGNSNLPVLLSGTVAASDNSSLDWQTIFDALRNEDCLEFSYAGGSRPGQKRRVRPLAVTNLGAQNPQLTGYCFLREQIRHFQLPLVRDLVAAQETDATETPAVKTTSAKAAAAKTVATKTITVRLLVNALAKEKLTAYAPKYYAQKPLWSPDSHGQWQFATLQLWRPENLYQLLAQAPGQLLVLYPEQLSLQTAHWANPHPGRVKF